MEIWKKIKHKLIIDDYLISDEGKIFRKSTNNVLKTTAKNPYNYVSRILKCVDGKERTFLVHRLVAETFIPNPKKLPIVDHIDSNKQNNKVSNLRWCTIKQNNYFRFEKEKKLNVKHTGKRILYKNTELIKELKKKGQ